MLGSYFRKAAASAALLLLAACTVAAPSQQFPDLTYSHLEPIRLDVARVDIVDEYRPPLTAPNVDHRAPVPPAQAARNWASDRLIVSGGGARRAVFTIQEAPIIETELDRTTGLRGAFTKDQSERYDATVAVRLEIFNPGGRRADSYGAAEYWHIIWSQRLMIGALLLVTLWSASG